MTTKWTPIAGDFEIGPESIIFHGKAIERTDVQGEPQTADPAKAPEPPRPTIGILVSNQSAGDGTVSAEIEFSGELNENVVAEFILNYSVETKAQVTAGLGGDWFAYSIRDWIPGRGSSENGRWSTLDVVGDRKNLQVGKRYQVEASLRGSRIRLSVDGVNVASGLLSRVLPQQGQVGLFCIGSHDITFRNIQVKITPSRAFVVMQYSSPFNEIYADVIKKACTDFGLEPIRADELYGPGLIVRDITEQILGSKVVIADVSPVNANVYFEVGYAYGVQKPTILLAEKACKLPFDLSGFRTLFYENTIAGRAQFDEGIRRHLASILGEAK